MNEMNEFWLLTGNMAPDCAVKLATFYVHLFVMLIVISDRLWESFVPLFSQFVLVTGFTIRAHN